MSQYIYLAKKKGSNCSKLKVIRKILEHSKEFSSTKNKITHFYPLLISYFSYN